MDFSMQDMDIMNFRESVSENLARYTNGTIFTVLFASWISYLISLSFFRLYLSPLAKFPGPKVAALSKWYEAYYEIILSGQYYRRIDELHDIYGWYTSIFMGESVAERSSRAYCPSYS